MYFEPITIKLEIDFDIDTLAQAESFIENLKRMGKYDTADEVKELIEKHISDTKNNRILN